MEIGVSGCVCAARDPGTRGGFSHQDVNGLIHQHHKIQIKKKKSSPGDDDEFI